MCKYPFNSRVFGRYELPSFAPALTLMAALSTVCFILLPSDLMAHGTTIAPESRVYKCRFRDNPENPQNAACKAAVEVGGSQALYDWNGINQANANGNHQNVVPDGELCGGGNPTFKGLNLARTDWMKTEIDAGNFQFVFHGTAPHATRDWVFYITNSEWDPSEPLSWDHLDEFCRHGGVPLQTDSQGRGVYRMNCEIPDKNGYQIIYNTWQRADSPEAFYTCMDVEMKGKSAATGCKDSDSGAAACFLPAIQILID